MRKLDTSSDFKLSIMKKFHFICPVCGQICSTITEEDIKKYLRTWELLEMKPLTDKQIEEYVNLSSQGFQYLGILCHNAECDCEFEIIITDIEEFLEFCENFVEEAYDLVLDLRKEKIISDICLKRDIS